eukprot:TRINITY_DN10279_c0_g1_i1.p1 TRINITY_DN10279_c0_g1~~TRINITY_DN10279_c0_g1_i1.p1  ORF type:complete len:440 (+),score=72.61 TRINITY_DN10279_c0_g1_i1:84-1403(+)
MPQAEQTSSTCWADPPDPRLTHIAELGQPNRPRKLPLRGVVGLLGPDWRKQLARPGPPPELIAAGRTYEAYRRAFAQSYPDIAPPEAPPVPVEGVVPQRNPLRCRPETAAPRLQRAPPRKLHPVPQEAPRVAGPAPVDAPRRDPLQRPHSAPPTTGGGGSAFERSLQPMDLTPAARSFLAGSFSAADANGDGALTRDEATDFLQRCSGLLGGAPESDTQLRDSVAALFRRCGVRLGGRLPAAALAAHLAASQRSLGLPSMRRVWLWRQVPTDVAVTMDCRAAERTDIRRHYRYAVLMAGCSLAQGAHVWDVDIGGDCEEAQVGVCRADAQLDLGRSLAQHDSPNAPSCWVYSCRGYAAHRGLPRLAARRPPSAAAVRVRVSVDITTGQVSFLLDGADCGASLKAPPGTALRPVCALHRRGARASLAHVCSEGGVAGAAL